jgi:uncharacterized repeat protein (TIGR01451 family)
LVFAIATVSFSVPSKAQLTLDQSYTASTDLSTQINICCAFIGQTYTAGITGVLGGVSVDVQSLESTDVYNLHVAIRTVSGGLPTTTILGEVTLSSGGSGLSQIIMFPQSIPQVAGVQYAIVVDYPGAPPGGNQGFWSGTTGNGYPRGDDVYSYDGKSFAFFAQNNFDLDFKTYVYPGAGLNLHSVASPTPPVPGGLMTYTFKVWNQSSVEAVHEVLTTQVPAGTTFSSLKLSGTADLGSCTTPAEGDSGPVVCHENSVMKPNSTWTIRLTVEITAPAGKVLTESATASSDNLASTSATVDNTVQPGGLNMRVIPSPTPPVQGGLLTYAFKTWNQSSGVAVNEVLTTEVPPGTTFSGITISGTPGVGSCSTPAVGGTGPVICKEGSSMKADSTWTVGMTVEVTAAAGTVITETATASSDNLASTTVTVDNTVD